MPLDASIPLMAKHTPPDFAKSFQEGFDIKNAPLEREQKQADTQLSQLKLASAKMGAIGNLLEGVDSQESYEAHMKAGIDMGIIPPEFAQKHPIYDPEGVKTFTNTTLAQKDRIDQQLQLAKIQEMKAGGSTGVLLNRLQNEPGLMDTYLGKANANKGLISNNGTIQNAPGYNEAVANTKGAEKMAEQQAILGTASDIEAAKESGKAIGEARGEQDKKAVNANNTLMLVDQAEKLLPMSTNGLGGHAMRGLANAVGVSTDASKADRQLNVLSAALTASVPKMSGPQSDKDVAMYKQAAGDVGNPDIPYEDRLAALQTIRTLQEKYKEGSSMPSDVKVQPRDIGSLNLQDARVKTALAHGYTPAQIAAYLKGAK